MKILPAYIDAIRPIFHSGMDYLCPECKQHVAEYPGQVDVCPFCGTRLNWGNQCRYCVHSYTDKDVNWHCNLRPSVEIIHFWGSCDAWSSDPAEPETPYGTKAGFECPRCNSITADHFQHRQYCKHCGLKLLWIESCPSCKHRKLDCDVVCCDITKKCISSEDWHKTCDDWEPEEKENKDD